MPLESLKHETQCLGEKNAQKQLPENWTPFATGRGTATLESRKNSVTTFIFCLVWISVNKRDVECLLLVCGDYG